MNSKMFALKLLFIALFSLRLAAAAETTDKNEKDQSDQSNEQTNGQDGDKEVEEKADNKDKEGSGKGKKKPTAEDVYTQMIVTEGIDPPECQRKLLISLGLEGLEKPKPTTLEMCKTLKSSCCQHADQLNIYDNWIRGAESESLSETLKEQAAVYDRVVDMSVQIHERAKTMAGLLKERKQSNCKILTSRILAFKIDNIAASVKAATKAMHDFFKESHKGFYCAVCDAANQKFIDVRGNKFVYDEKFCRLVTQNSLNFLLYFHVHFNKYLNLLTRFMTSCGDTGRYAKRSLKSAPVFASHDVAYNKLMACRKYRNKEHWMDHCGDICSAFQVTKYNDFFAPNLRKFDRFNRHMARRFLKLKQIAREKAEQAKAKKAEEASKDKDGDGEDKNKAEKAGENSQSGKKNRKLSDGAEENSDEGSGDEPEDDNEDDDQSDATEEADDKGDKGDKGDKKNDKKDKKDEKYEKRKEDKKDKKVKKVKRKVDILTTEELEDLLTQIYVFERNPPVIRSAMGSEMNIENYQSKFQEKGMNLYSYGTNTDISEGSLKNINHKEEEEDQIMAAKAIVSGLGKKEKSAMVLTLWSGLMVCLAMLLLN